MSIEHKLIWSIVFFILFSLAVYVYTARASEYSDAVGFFFCYLIYNMFKNIARGEGGEGLFTLYSIKVQLWLVLPKQIVFRSYYTSPLIIQSYNTHRGFTNADGHDSLPVCS